MIISKLAAAAAISLTATPLLAANAGPSVQPAAESVIGANSLEDDEDGNAWAAFLLGGVILTGFILILLKELDDDDDDVNIPVSP